MAYFSYRARNNQLQCEGLWENDYPHFADTHFRWLYRVPPSIFDYVHENIKDSTDSDLIHSGRPPVPTDKKLAIFQRFVGSDSYVLDLGMQYNMSPATVIKCRDVSQAL